MSNQKIYVDEIVRDSSPLDKELVSAYARRDQISYQESERRIKLMIDVIRELLVINFSITLRRLGVFRLHTRKSCRYRNKKTKMMEVIPLIRVVKFKPAASLKEAINEDIKKVLKEKIKESRGLQ